MPTLQRPEGEWPCPARPSCGSGTARRPGTPPSARALDLGGWTAPAARSIPPGGPRGLGPGAQRPRERDAGAVVAERRAKLLLWGGLCAVSLAGATLTLNLLQMVLNTRGNGVRCVRPDHWGPLPLGGTRADDEAGRKGKGSGRVPITEGPGFRTRCHASSPAYSLDTEVPGLPTPGEREFVTHSLKDGCPILSMFPMTPGKIAGASGPNEFCLPVQHRSLAF